MKILSMTATFGKLSNQTLALNSDLNIIEAHNEWGKSTWCAFLMAMLYGIDTGSRTKTGFLADKEHYAPWSGEPMSGRMDIQWNGREITLERTSKGRTPMGEVRAYETHTGVPVPELAVAVPGQVLLGAERSVFARAGFLRLAEMPVTEDEALRRRLNELVTTGDESGASDALAQKLRDLKNKCRFNKKGLLPEAEARKADLEQKLQQLQGLQQQVSVIESRQEALKTQISALENHRQALEYNEQLLYAQKLAAAQVSRDSAAEKLAQAQAECDRLPTSEQLQTAVDNARRLRDTRERLHTKAQLLPPLPQMPEAPEVFRGKDPDTVVQEAAQDRMQLELLSKSKSVALYILGALLLAAGAALLFVQLIIGGFVLAAGIGALLLGVLKQNKQKQQANALTDRYRGLPADRWETAANAYAESQKIYAGALSARQAELAELNRLMEENDAAISALTGGVSIFRFEENCNRQLEQYRTLQERKNALRQAEDVLQALSGAGRQVAPPAFEDTLTYTPQQTQKLFADATYEQQQLRQRLGQCQGQMASLGSEESLQAQISQLQSRIQTLERYYGALTRAQEALLQATQELQRRFAPRISQRAQALFARLTGQRYQRLTLGQDMSVEAGAEGENTLRGTLWRSDGTVDQLYLALRLAVAEELMPDAPLVLDDALVRFDDTRLASALEILQEESRRKQVILFTCQSREKALSKGE